MSSVWRTKWGWRSIRVEPPTIQEALDAVEGLTGDPQQRVQLAADLMGLPISQVQEIAASAAKSAGVRAVTLPDSRQRAPVVVERKVRRRVIA